MKNNALCLKRSVTGRLPLTRALATFAAIALFAGCDLLFPDGGTNGGETPASTFKITYYGNSNTGGTAPTDSNLYTEGAQAIVLAPDSALQRNGYVFNGWTESSDGFGPIYMPNTTLSMTKSLTLYARWISDTVPSFQITYYGNGATSGSVPVDPTYYTVGQTAIVSRDVGNMKKGDDFFAEWNEASAGSGSIRYASSTITMNGDVSLYAQYLPGRNFYSYNFVTDEEFVLTAVLRAEGTHALVYVDNDLALTTVTAENVAAEFDNNVYPKMIDAFSSWEDVDGNGKLIVLLQDILDGATEDSGYIAGYFNSGDMYEDSWQYPSNEADMINMDVSPAIPGDANFNGTLAHELQHLINFSVTGGNSETWLNEGLSTSAEYVYAGTNEGSRVGDYNYSGDYTIAYGNNFFVWDGYWENLGTDSDLLSNYTTAYMFFQWLRVHAANDIGIYREILESGYGDYRAVTSVAESRIDIKFSNWPTLMRTWYAANLCNDANGFYGYKGQLGPLEKWVVQPSEEWIGQYLYPGEGIIAVNELNQFTPDQTATNISYSGIDEGALLASSTVDSVSPYTGAYTLALNGNTNIQGVKEPGYFPVASRSTPSRNIGAALMTLEPGPVPERGSYPIDVVMGAEGRGR